MVKLLLDAISADHGQFIKSWSKIPDSNYHKALKPTAILPGSTIQLDGKIDRTSLGLVFLEVPT